IENPIIKMCMFKYFFAFFVLLLSLMKRYRSIKYIRGMVPKERPFVFLESKLAELEITDPPYTVFNFATEAANTVDVIEDELKKKDNKAMRRFKHDLSEKKERTADILVTLLKDALQFFDYERS
ncbi:hypothetical protein, conserved, partial [Plasmodium gonderi]